jgi:hypothetical protein
LKDTQKDGNWEKNAPELWQGGTTALALLALLHAGEKPDSKVIADGLKYLRSLETKYVYTLSLQTLVFCKAADKQDRERSQRNTERLLQGQRKDGLGRWVGWTYGLESDGPPDNSNTAFAVSALHAADLAGARVEKEVWEAIQKYYLDTQLRPGGWPYRDRLGASLSMSCHGVAGLFITEKHLKHKPDELGRSIKKGLQFIGDAFKLTSEDANCYYLLYSLSHAGRLSGKKILGEAKDQEAKGWYQLGAEFLVKEQAANGSWKVREAWPGVEIHSTCFALLFLSDSK